MASKILLGKSLLIISMIIFLTSLVIRLLLFYQVWDDRRHPGNAGKYGSAAIGLYYNHGLTVNWDEIGSISSESEDNHSGNYLTFHNNNNREPLIEYLPAPAVVLYLLWKIIPIYNFSTYIWMVIIIDSILITIFFLVLRKRKYLSLVVVSFLILNIPTLRQILTMGYDFWPIFCVMANIIGLYSWASIQDGKSVKGSLILIFLGIINGFTIWSRSLILFLPIFLSGFIFIINFKQKNNYVKLIHSLILYLLPYILSLLLLMYFRYNTTGDIRPTRSTFWHEFFLGVGQFSNPYGIECKDISIWEFGKRINPELNKYSLQEMYELPNSPYEVTLRMEALSFIKNYPHLFIRNIVLRIPVFISPFLYKWGDFIPPSFNPYLFPIGIIGVLLWFLGMFNLQREDKNLFILSFVIFLHYFMIFGWFNVIGRLILAYNVLNIIAYYYGLQLIISNSSKLLKNKSG